MSIQFAHWHHPTRGEAGDRIYINGLPVAGKVWFQRVGQGGAALKGDELDDAGTEDAAYQIVDALKAAGVPQDQCDMPTWKLLTAIAQANPPKRPGTPPVVRPDGAQAGMMARPSAVTARPGSATLDFSKIVIQPPGLVIHADHREPQAIVDLLRTIKNLEVIVDALPVGDFRAGNIIIERKVVRDLEQSIMNGRLFDEANRMGLEPDCIGVVLIEGDVFGEAESLVAQNLIGAITCLSHVQGLNVWTSVDYRTTAYAIAKIAQHANQGLGYELALRKEKPKVLIDEKVFITQGMPGVSGYLAKALLDHFGSVRAVANADAAALRQVKGLGPKTADRIVAAMT